MFLALPHLSLWIPVKSNKLVGKVYPPPPSPAGCTGRSSAGLHSMPVRFQSQVLSGAEQSFLVRACVCVYVAWPHQLFIVDYRRSISLDLGLLLLLPFTTSITTKFKNAVSEEMESIHVAAYTAGSNINQLLSVCGCVCVSAKLVAVYNVLPPGRMDTGKRFATTDCT